METPADIRNKWLKKFYEIYMDSPKSCISFGLDTFDDEDEREIRWLIDRGWLDNPPNSLRLSVAGRNEYERQQAEGGGPCPTCGRE
ncbi:hypothetical protein [Paraliomyxa miuraensis]|uniref:hypothetical protein n=1 Tax=Paraliomyxa miuraensis TaxID=376150 RepID=UPI00225C28EE|nr:hypothetical protein [Paraliomyxa miuraensis]MCX4240186.1 hypothetical protein [Paraliomyxa miuraensis]